MLQVFAYLDAGTGSLFIQAILGVALAASVVLRGFINRTFYKVKLAFARQTTKDEES